MGVRGELFTTQVVLDNRTYFFDVKENRTGDVFLQVVESKNKNGEAFDRHAICVFSEDMQKFCKGFEDSLSFIEKARKEKAKAIAEKKAAKRAGSGNEDGTKRVYRRKDGSEPRQSDGIKRTGKVHIVSKRNSAEK